MLGTPTEDNQKQFAQKSFMQLKREPEIVISHGDFISLKQKPAPSQKVNIYIEKLCKTIHFAIFVIKER